ncbi:DUF262 domain-containing protein [Streptomyces sp. NPDC005727]|uniref:DUF262 domain-containing protein n=1 Tax=Streptomyces sp. NPDC005727 TaxID=3157053 RepID=UPI0033F666ED
MRLRRSDLEVEVLYNRIARGELDLQPDYQRGEVWDTVRRQRLVDTILRNWYVPAIHVVRDATGSESVLDGQQRLRTIQAFMDNEFKLSGRIDPLSPDLAAYDGCFFRDLPDSWKKRFQRFEISVVTLTEYQPAEPSELFFRLNQQYALTPPEKRNALFGKARDQVKELVSALTQEGLLRRDVIGFSNGRLAYDDIIARLCIVLQEGSLRRQLNNSYIEEFYRGGEFERAVIKRAYDAGAALSATLQGRRLMRFNKATLFTWLVFSDWVLRETKSPIYTRFVESFETLRSKEVEETGLLELSDYELTLDPELEGVAKAYNDRASYRVLDVTSVLVRDFALHLLYDSANSRRLAVLAESFKTAGNAEEKMLAEIERLDWGYQL